MWLGAPCTFRVQEMKLIWGKEDLVQRTGTHSGFLSSTVANTHGEIQIRSSHSRMMSFVHSESLTENNRNMNVQAYMFLLKLLLAKQEDKESYL